ncbi:TetR family transcriptional regulator [Brevibacterium aurantiacum]|uniref:TetR family transcriptional regulator n=1 Tax=Brevibacterium aurantiacum TaxID=273384 RepID=UPI001F4977DC|nr:TetR family transcriptional regulator [Brevibacterium aurantiacum]
MVATSRDAGTSAKSLETRVRDAIKTAGIKHSEVARSMGIEPSKLSKSLTGTRKFRVEEISQISELTHVTTDWLTTGRSDEPPRRRMVAAMQNPNVHEPDSEDLHTLMPDPGPSFDPEWMSKGTRNRRKIIAAAWELYADRGIDNVRNLDIAAASGLSASAVNYHFRTKNQLLEAALRYSLEIIAGARELSNPDDPVATLRHFARVHSGVNTKVRRVWSIWIQSWPRAIVDESTRLNLTAVYSEWLDLVTGVILAGQRGGDVRPGDTALMIKSLAIFIDGLGVARSTGQLAITDDEALAMLENYLSAHILASGPPADDASAVDTRNPKSERVSAVGGPDSKSQEEGT